MRRDDEYAAAASVSHIDDEYARAGIEDPKVFITTSRSPSSRLAQFAKVVLIHLVPFYCSVSHPCGIQEMKILIPNSTRVNRGNQVMPQLVDACRRRG